MNPLPARTFEGPADLGPLFAPLRLNAALALPNRIVLAPCTRNRATADHSPTPGAVEHYASRADAGLLVTEAAMVARDVQGYVDTPGIFADAHIEPWSRVADAVHARGGRIFCQLWHLGRVAHSHFGGVPRAPSAVVDHAERRQARVTGLFNETPLAMSEADIAHAIGLFAAGARRAKAAGFDGVEIHGANGYLVEQFLRQHTNRRSDAWGGAPQKRARFAVELLDACIAEFGAERVGLRLSPAAYFCEMRYTEGDNDSLIAVIEAARSRDIAYLHAGIVEDDPRDYLGGGSAAFLRRRWTGVLIGNGGYTPEAAAAHVGAGAFDLVSFGKRFLANPDLVAKLRDGRPLAPYGRPVLDAFT